MPATRVCRNRRIRHTFADHWQSGHSSQGQFTRRIAHKNAAIAHRRCSHYSFKKKLEHTEVIATNVVLRLNTLGLLAPIAIPAPKPPPTTTTAISHYTRLGAAAVAGATAGLLSTYASTTAETIESEWILDKSNPAFSTTNILNFSNYTIPPANILHITNLSFIHIPNLPHSHRIKHAPPLLILRIPAPTTTSAFRAQRSDNYPTARVPPADLCARHGHTW